MSKHCEQFITEIHGLTPAESKAIVKKLAEVQAKFPDASRVSIEIKRAAQKKADILREAAKYTKRDAKRHALTFNAIKERVDTDPNAFDSMEGYSVGTNRPATEGRRSVAAMQKTTRRNLQGGLVGELEKASPGLFDRALKTKSMWRDIVREMFDGGDRSFTGNEDAFNFAVAARKWKEIARLRANKAGARIANISEHVIAQSHVASKLLRAKFNKWAADILPKLDHERTFGLNDPMEFLQEAYTNITTGMRKDGKSGFTGNSLAGRLSRERVLHFKDADSFMDYHGQYGQGSIVGGIFEGIGRLGDDIALMERFGPDPDKMHADLLSHFGQRIMQEGGTSSPFQITWKGQPFFNPIEALKHRYDAISGKMSVAKSPHMGAFFRGARQTQDLSKMGGVLLSSIPDTANRGVHAQTIGMSAFRAYGDMIHDLFKGYGSVERVELSRQLLGAVEGMMNNVSHRLSVEDGAPGVMSGLSNLMFKLNGLQDWTDLMDIGHAISMSGFLARNAGKVHSQLPKLLSDTLSKYGIGRKEWDLMRKSGIATFDDVNYITPDLLHGKGHFEAAQKLQTFFVTEVDIAVLKPGARERAIATQGTQPGTWGGEILRNFWQFRMFSLSMMTKAVPNALRAGVPGAVHMAVGMSVLGYVAMTLKDIVKGREPRKLSAKTVSQAILQGGGLGILGDVLLNNFNEYGRTLPEVAGGVVTGAASDIFKVASGLMRGSDKSAQAFRIIKGNTPFVNLFYTQQALDYLFFYHMQEWMNPGYLRRYERRIMRENNQEFWMRPSEVVGRGGFSFR